MAKMTKTKTKPSNIITTMERGQFARWFPDKPADTWRNWKTILKAAHGMPLSANELKFFKSVSGDRDPPTKKVRELWLAVGRRGGKNAISSLLVAEAASQFDGKRRTFAGFTLPALRPGERASIICIGRDRDNAQIALDYISSYFDEIPELAGMVTRKTRTGLELSNGVTIVVGTNDFRAVRGRAVLMCILDECAFYSDENSANPDTELYGAITPGMLTLRDQAMLIGISTVHKKSGLLWNKYCESFGKNDPNVLFVLAPTIELNPTVDLDVIAAEIEADPELKLAEYYCQWRTDISNFIDASIYDSCVVRGRSVIAKPDNVECIGFVDVSGGAHDSHTCGVAFPDGEITVLASVRELKTPDTESVVHEFSDLLKSYGVRQVYSDRYGAAWVSDAFKRKGIQLLKSPHARSDIYANFSPMLNAGQVRLLDNKRLRTQVLALERRTIRGTSRAQIDHPRAGEDDLANAAAGALVMARKRPGSRVSVGTLPKDGKEDNSILSIFLNFGGFWTPEERRKYNDNPQGGMHLKEEVFKQAEAAALRRTENIRTAVKLKLSSKEQEWQMYRRMAGVSDEAVDGPLFDYREGREGWEDGPGRCTKPSQFKDPLKGSKE